MFAYPDGQLMDVIAEDTRWHPDCICGGSAACPVHNRECIVIGSTDAEAVEAIFGYRPPTPCRWIPTIEQGSAGNT